MTRVLRCAWLLLLLMLPLLATAAPRAFLDRDTIRIGETVTLNVETDGRGGAEPDFALLARDFRLLGTSSSTQLSFVNGRQTARALWAVALEPLRDGVIGIPALVVGGESTAPLSLTVLPQPAGGSAQAGDDVFLEVEAEPAAPYVQQQVRYTVRLYYAVQLLEGQLEEPQPQGAQVRRLGQDVQFQKTIGERRYNVVERRYAVLPEASGKLEIPGPGFRGRALVTGSYGSSMSPSAILSARGNAAALDVRPRPPGAPTPWMPAQSLQLSDESAPPPTPLKVGEPLTLTLRLVARGLSAEQLPELALPRIEGAEVYPDQESSATGDDGQWLRGERVRKFAIVPTRAGPLQLPEIAIDWWDADNDRAARATLPARRIDVVGADGAVVQTPSSDASSAESDAVETTPAALPLRSNPWVWATAAFAALWLATLAWRRQRRGARIDSRGVAPPVAPPAPDVGRAWAAALQRGDAGVAAQALIALARARSPGCRSLADVAGLLDDAPQRDAVARLEEALYRDAEADPAVLETLRSAFARAPRWRHATDGVADSGPLPPLYPERERR